MTRFQKWLMASLLVENDWIVSTSFPHYSYRYRGRTLQHRTVGVLRGKGYLEHKFIRPGETFPDGRVHDGTVRASILVPTEKARKEAVQ